MFCLLVCLCESVNGYHLATQIWTTPQKHAHLRMCVGVAALLRLGRAHRHCQCFVLRAERLEIDRRLRLIGLAKGCHI